MTYPNNLPDPTLDQQDFIVALAALGEPINLRHYRDAAGKDRLLWMREIAQRISSGVHAGILTQNLTHVSAERVNFYSLTEEAAAFWQNGLEQDLSNVEILNGWNAMRSIMKDGMEES